MLKKCLENVQIEVTAKENEIKVKDLEIRKLSEIVDRLTESLNNLTKEKSDCEDKIECLTKKIDDCEKENEELKDTIMAKTMFYDTFKDEMKDRFGYDSDEEAEACYQQLIKDQEDISCDQCSFVAKNKQGLRTHKGKMHKER